MSKPDDNLSATRSHRYITRLEALASQDDLPERWKCTPIEDFIGAHNFDKEVTAGTTPRLLIVSCMEFRFQPQIPRNFAYVIRTPGGRISNIPGTEFALAYVIANGVKHIVTVGHNQCGMTKVDAFKPKLVEALISQGWEETHAHTFIEENAGSFAIKDEIDSLKFEFLRLRELFKNVEIAPLFVSLSSSRLHLPTWYSSC